MSKLLLNFGRSLRRFYCSILNVPCFQNTKCAAQVSILGADTPTGRLLSFLLKQNPWISVLHLQGASRVESMGLDLSHFDTKCRVETYFDMDSVSKSIKSSDIIVMLGLNTNDHKMKVTKLAMAEGLRVAKLAEECAKYAPRSIMVVAVTPISVTLPIVAGMYKKTHWYHPGRLLGSVAIPEIKANGLAGQYQNLDPRMVQVPLVGGPDLDCSLPLFSSATPVGMNLRECAVMLRLFREETPTIPVALQAYGLNRMITGIAKGICGVDSNLVAFVRSNVINTCRYMVATVKVGRNGVYHNYGLRRLNRTDLTEFERVALLLKEREQMGADIANRKDKCAVPAFVAREAAQEREEQLGVIH